MNYLRERSLMLKILNVYKDNSCTFKKESNSIVVILEEMRQD